MTRFLWLALACAVAAPAFGQNSPGAGHGLAAGDFSVEKTAGFSWFSPAGTSLGDVSDRRVYLAGIRRSWIGQVRGPFAVAYTTELVPLAVVERTGPNTRNCFPLPTGQRACRFDRSQRVAVGFGGSPLGARLYFNRAGRWRAHVGGAGGALLFSTDVPIYDSRHFNFTFEYGGAVELLTGGGKAIALGYKFHHVSNAGTGRLNPGLDANVVYLGVTRWRARP